MRTARLPLLFLPVFLFFSACNRHGMFYYPNRVLYADPEKMGMPYEMLRYPSQNGNQLYAILFRTEQSPKGIVVHFHGNFGNISNHFLESQYLVKYGFDVLVFDYQGFGGSEGRPTPKRTVQDGIATVHLAQRKNRGENGGVVVIGQSIGAAVATAVAAKEPLVKGVVLEAGFTAYRSIARVAIQRSILLWPLYPFYPLILTWSWAPIDYIDDIAPRPVFIIHGTADRIIPFRMSQQLYDKAREPKKLWMIEGADHLRCRTAAGERYEQAVADFFAATLAEAPKNNN